MKRRTSIEIRDKRGTSITLRLFLAPLMVADYVRELANHWKDIYGGNPDAVIIDGTAHDFAHFVRSNIGCHLPPVTEPEESSL